MWGILDPGYMTLAFAYEAFVYIAAQIINSSRIRWEDLKIRSASGDSIPSSVIDHAIADYRDSYATFLLLNGWLVAFLLFSLCILALRYQGIVTWSVLPSSIGVPAFWCAAMLILSGLTESSFAGSFRRETRQMGVEIGHRLVWPFILQDKGRKDA